MTSTTSLLEHQQVSIDGLSLHLVRGGFGRSPGLLFLHGWPQSARCFEPLMEKLAEHYEVLAIDLPGIGRSPDPPARNDKRSLARLVHHLVRDRGLDDLVLVGHDAGGMITYAYLRDYPDDLRGAVIMNVAIPGLDPWDEVTHNPAVWHFGFHAVPDLPERLVAGHVAAYFDHFFDAIAASPAAVGKGARRAAVDAYSSLTALSTGFEWYRAFKADAEANADGRDAAVEVPLLYLRGEEERRLSIGRYVEGFKAAGVVNVTGQLIPDAGHFAPDESPEALAEILCAFVSQLHAHAG